MVWQDIVMFVCMILFSYALIPQIWHNYKSKKGSVTIQTSLITGIGTYVITFALLTLGLYLSAGIDFVIGTLWFVLFVQRVIYKHHYI